MRNYANLQTLLSRETNSRIPRAAARMIESQFNEKHNTATDFVLFKLGANWTVLPVGPNEAFPTIAQAARAKTSHGRAIAHCPRSPQTVKRPNPFAEAQ